MESQPKIESITRDRLWEYLTPHDKRVLKTLAKKDKFSQDELAAESGLSKDIVWTSVSLLNERGRLFYGKDICEVTEKVTHIFTLTKEGEQYAQSGLPERQIINSISVPISLSELKKKFPPQMVGIALGWLRRKNWARIDGDMIIPSGKADIGEDEKILAKLKEGPSSKVGEVVQELIKRNLVEKTEEKTRIIVISESGKDLLLAKGSKIEEPEIAQLTPTIITSGAWKTVRYLFSWDEVPGNDNGRLIEFLTQKFCIDWAKIAKFEKIDDGKTIIVTAGIHFLSLRLNNEKTEVKLKINDGRTAILYAKLESGKLNIYTENFRPYNIRTPVKPVYGAKIHPYQRLINEMRSIFLEMGFTEIKGDIVQSSFWNFDALFQPQDHPAREMQDTFHLATECDLPEEYIKPVKEMHEKGGGISSGWGGRWSEEVARKQVLRTHTTAITIKYLAEHPDPPVKAFCIDRAYRREAIDPTHTPEFEQLEGVVMDKGVSFKNLLGCLTEFYHRMGFEEVRFRPGYFPYTEPSVEPEVYIESRGKWVELGGAGVFRKEVTLPLGIKHPVLAWGLGVSRVAMLRLGLKDLRELYQSDIDWLRKSTVL